MRKFFILLLLKLIFFTSKGWAQTYYFPPLTGNSWDTLSPTSLNYCPEKIDSLYNFLQAKNTKAFILLKDGKIVLEKYFGAANVNTLLPWNSAGKTITSLLIGIAQQEGYLNINDSSSKYMGQGWTSCSPAQEGKITIRHQLTMTTGLDDAVADPFCTTSNCLVYKVNAGTRWAYHNAPYTLLDSVILTATGKTLNQYTNQKIKMVTGITGQFYKIGYNNVYVSNARSMARFGSLILNKGRWDNTQVLIDTNYFNQMVNTSQPLNKAYGYLWWLNGKSSFMLPQTQFVFSGLLFPHAPADVIAAMGKDGQFLNICPSKNMVWLRLGDSPDGLPVPYLLNDEIWDYVNKLSCATDVGNKSTNTFSRVTFNFGNESIIIKSSEPILFYQIIDTYGRVLDGGQSNAAAQKIDVSGYSKGIYFLKVELVSGVQFRKFLIK